MSSAAIPCNGDPLLQSQIPNKAATFNSKHRSPLQSPIFSQATHNLPQKSSLSIASNPRLGDPSPAASASDRSPKALDAFAFNSLIQSHISNSRFSSALALYPDMIFRTVSPNQYTFPIIFKACSLSSDLSAGTQLHAQSLKLGFLANVFAAVALMDMYMKNGEVGSARKVFDGMAERDAVAWNALLAGYTQNGKPEEALLAYNQMQSAGFAVGQLAIASLIAACSQLLLLPQGKLIHSWVVKSGFEADTVIATALLDMYGNCDEIMSAKRVFDEMDAKDPIAWNCLISSCAQNGCVDDAAKFFLGMQNSGLKPNGSSLAGVLPALAHSGMLNFGKSCHGFAVRNDLESDAFVLTALLDFYAKSGDLLAAHRIFDAMIGTKSVVAWSALIAGYGIHGQGLVALTLFEDMLERKIRPNHVTYVGVLLACAHSGLVKEGREHLSRMVQDHGIAPRSQHFACVTDLLARAGLFEEAVELIESMPVEPTPGIWGALLGGCRIHGNIELAEYAASRLFGIHSSDPGFYVLLSNTYASGGMWEEVRGVRYLMRERGMRKEAGWSSIEIGSRATFFLSGDVSHPDCTEIYKTVEELLLTDTATEV